MRRYLPGRLLRHVGSLGALLVLNFLLPRWMPGDPVAHLVGVEDYVRYPELVADVRERFGLDRSLPTQFALYLRGLATGDLGHSLQYGEPVAGLVARRLAWTLVLVVPALGLGGLLAGAAGAVAGWYGGRRWERGVTLAIVLLRSVPQYGLAMLALFFLAFHLNAFPLGGLSTDGGVMGILRHAALPILVLGLSSAAHLYLVMRNMVMDIRPRPFIAAARARGLSEGAVLAGHAVPNAALPFLSLFALGVGFSVAGALLVEVVFSWPGMGTLILSAVDRRDYPLLQGCFLLITVTVLLANAASDAIAGALDPRIRHDATP